jgi:glycine oxidase
MTHRTADIIIIGGGVIGLAIARTLRRDGLRVALFEKNSQLGGEASWAAAGMLAPQSEAAAPGPLLDLCLVSRALYPTFAAELRAETGIDIELRTDGTLLPAFSEREAQRQADIADWQRAAGLEATNLSASEAFALEPSLSPNVHSALFFPNDWQTDNRRLTHALIASVHAAGVEIRCGADDITLHSEGNRIQGAHVSGERWSAPIVVNAAGSWAARLPPEALRLPTTSVRPIRGQMLAAAMEPPNLLRHVIRTERAYLVPRFDGRLVVGATVEDVGYAKRVTAGGVARLLDGAIATVPALAEAALLETWAGLRPLAEDDLPILGATELDGLLCATGHYRNGILLTPVTAEIIRRLALGEPPPLDVTPFSPVRFYKRAGRRMPGE